MRHLFEAYSYPDYQNFTQASFSPKKYFSDLWRETINLCAQSSFWSKRLGLKGSLDIPLRAFEITNYSDYHETLNRDFQNRSASTLSSLNGKPQLGWIKSSATTNKTPKLIPLTEPFLSQQTSVFKAVICELLKLNKNYLSQPILTVGTPSTEERSPSGLPVEYSNFYFSLPPSACAIPPAALKNTSTYLEWSYLYALGGDISAIHGLSPVRIHQFVQTIINNYSEYIHKISAHYSNHLKTPHALISQKRLQYLLNLESRLVNGLLPSIKLKDLWPSLQFIRLWTSGISGAQLHLLNPYLTDDVKLVDFSYCATEGVFTVPIYQKNSGNSETPGGALATHSIILEFLKIGDSQRTSNLIPPWELLPNEKYEVFVTNRAGLIRYRMEDVIRCNGFYNKTPIIEFLYRTQSSLTLGGATLTEAEVMLALADVPFSIPGHWYIDINAHSTGFKFVHDICRIEIDALVKQLDLNLRKINPLYNTCISNGTLQPLSNQYLHKDHPQWITQLSSHNQGKPCLFKKHPSNHYDDT